MSKRHFSVRICDARGGHKLHVLPDGDTTIGCDASSDITIEGESRLLPRHLLLSPRDEACWVSTSPGAPVWTEDNMPVDADFVPWNTRLCLGQTWLELKSGTSTGHGADARRRGAALFSGNHSGPGADTGRASGVAKNAGALLAMLILCTLGFAVHRLLTDSTVSASALPTGEPALFEESVVCSSVNSLFRGARAADAARAKSESSVFDLQHGIASVNLFAEAAACYRAAGREQQAEELAQEAQKLREVLLGEYKLIRLRLDRALTAGDTRVAEAQARRLMELLRHRQESQLGLALRRLALQLSRKN